MPSRFLRSISARIAAAVGLSFVLLAGSSSTVDAQGTTTGAIRGRVTDDAGAPVDAAALSAVNSETGFTRVAQSGADGQYMLRLLPPGMYTVTARRIGFQARAVAEVRVIVGSTTPVDMTISPTAVTLADVEIIAQAAEVDVTNAGVKKTVGQEEIDNLPALGRDFTDFINLSGLVSPQPEETTGGQFSIAGARPSQTSLQIDGVDANNSFFGENRGGSRIPFAFSLESIREFQIITNGFDVEYGNYSGGIVNIVTRGGTNTFGGSVYGNIRDDALTANNFDGTEPNNYEVQQYAARVEGPVIEDRLFYLFSLDGQRRREPFRPFNVEAFRREGDIAEADSLQRFLSILESVYGIDNPAAGYAPFEITNDVLTLFGRVDWTLNDRNRLSVRNNFSDYENANEAGGFAIDGGRSQAERLTGRTNSLVAELTSQFSPVLYNVARVQYATENRPRVGNELRPTLIVNAGIESFEYGGNFISFNNDLDESKIQIIDNLTFVAGSHTLKAGTNNTFSSFDNAFWLNGSGNFNFNSLADFEAGIASSYDRGVRADGLPPMAEFSAQEYSFYAQDEWQATNRLLGILGLRYDVARYGDRPGRVIDVERAFGFETGTAPIDNNNVSPRVSFTYDLNGNATDILRAGAGLFYGRVPFVLGSNVAITDVPFLSLQCRGEPGDPDAPPSPTGYGSFSSDGSDNPFNCAGAAGVGGVPSYTFWQPDFEIPETLKANIGYERLFMASTRASVDLIFSESDKLYTVRNLNLREAQFTLDGEGGRRVFVPEAAFVPANSAGSARLRNTDFGNLLINYNDGVARSFAATFNLDHRFGESSQLTGSYTYTRAHDNSSYSCCTANEGFTGQDYGALGPNVIGAIGDEAAGWGPSDFVRNHTFILSGIIRLPWDIRATTIWRLQSGTPWTPEIRGDINGDGVRFNDRPFIFRPEDLPVFVPAGTPAGEADAIIAQNRSVYAELLAEHDCVGDYVGQIVPRNTCRQPWFNRFDLSLRKEFATFSGQSAELSLDLFNVLNGLDKGWGRYEAVQGPDRNLVAPQAYDPATGDVLYTVSPDFAESSTLGGNLLLQFSAQVGVRYSF
ncbi:MAG: TonB-dependent receptor [Gemmatimonadaceae bacterium]